MNQTKNGGCESRLLGFGFSQKNCILVPKYARLRPRCFVFFGATVLIIRNRGGWGAQPLKSKPWQRNSRTTFSLCFHKSRPEEFLRASAEARYGKAQGTSKKNASKYHETQSLGCPNATTRILSPGLGGSRLGGSPAATLRKTINVTKRPLQTALLNAARAWRARRPRELPGSLAFLGRYRNEKSINRSAPYLYLYI